MIVAVPMYGVESWFYRVVDVDGVTELGRAPAFRMTSLVAPISMPTS